MAPSTRSAFVAFASAAVVVAQQSTVTFPATPLNQLVFPHPTDAPYQIYGPNDPIQYVRGPQTGYNICNSTTEGQSSMCQTMYVNGLDDFCLWGPPAANSLIADTEGEEVAWCVKSGYGTRRIQDGLFKSVQLLKTSEYYMIVGTIDQTLINIQSTDSGGELDSGGQDERGNPIGGLVYSTIWETNNLPTQIEHWTEFIGNNQFCIKVCNPNGTNPDGYCQHTLDRIGLGYNCPSKYTVGGNVPANGDFEICDSDLMMVPGLYVQNGQTLSYSQPPESLGQITTIPYQPSLVSSSNCQTFSSAALFTGLASPTSGASSAAPTGASASGTHASASASASGSRTGSAQGSSATGVG
ncbi:hypothetical protein K488DRAFT_80676 [Vararia minispora EC-137]|uniref:Uncharacterized protein n=1 Tax=Vararia minispora EC-137 TaxID=1314806 RepID=A0ACB8Q9T0_9AGAM|nr:hypothetical protein K488DRAFT_80676 [Vararia minispora EC-137]